MIKHSSRHIKHVGEEITIKGWLYKLSFEREMMFPPIRDGQGIIQGVVFKEERP